MTPSLLREIGDFAIINVDEMIRLFSESVAGLVAYSNGAFCVQKKPP